MGDSDEDYDTMSKRRGQSRNKFRKERDDLHESNNNNDSQNDVSGSRRNKSGIDSNNGNGINRMHTNSGSGPYGVHHHNASMQPYHSDYRRRAPVPHHIDKDLEDLDEDDLAHQAYRDVPGYRYLEENK